MSENFTPNSEAELSLATPKTPMPLRNQIRNFARNWGDYISMHKHAEGVWWFECSGHGGYLVAGRECPVDQIPGAELFLVGNLRDGSGVFAFDDDGDHYLLEWFNQEVANSVYSKGHNGKDKENEYWTTFHQKGGFEGFQRYLGMAVEHFYPEIGNSAETWVTA